jgi:hypothetical protein
MALESTTYIDGLVTTNPTGTDPRSQGDDHLRMLKSSIRATFPNVAGAMTATHTELNLIDGYTGTTAELNYNDIPTLGTVEASKTITADAVGTTKKLKTQEQTSIVNALGTISGATAINFTLGNVVTAVLASGGSFTISNAPASGIYGKFKFILTNGGTVSDPWHASVKFAGGTTPTLTSSGIDIITFETIDNGANWYAVVDGLDMK